MKSKQLYSLFAIAAIVALIGAGAVAPQTAYAQSAGGTGTLTASGDGLAGIRGNGSIYITGNGVLWIRDHNGDAVINVSGYGERKVMPNGWIRYIGFHGEATVSGSWVTVALSGYNIYLQASGTGKFVLRGEGTYDTGKFSGVWSENVEVIPLP